MPLSYSPRGERALRYRTKGRTLCLALRCVLFPSFISHAKRKQGEKEEVKRLSHSEGTTMKLQISGGRILTEKGWMPDGSVFCEDGTITEISEGAEPREGYTVVDAKNFIVGPGGIDMHLHGGNGRDFMECSEEAFRTVIDAHMRHGTTALFPTLASSSNEMIRKAADICTRLMQEKGSPVMGLHLEGPYLNMKKCGGQWPEMIRNANPEEYIPLLEDFPCIKRWDASPELPGALEFGRECRKRGVLVGMAHTEADYGIVEKAFEDGFTHVTHFYNAMTGVHNEREFKHEGTIESVYMIDGISVELIADGIHVPPVLLRLVHKVKGPERISLITDAIASTASTSDEVFDKNTIIEDGVCKLADRSALAGSIATMDRLVSTMINKCHMSWEDTFTMTSTTTAKLMHIDHRKGSITVGKDADICIYSPDATLKCVIQAGRIIKEY